MSSSSQLWTSDFLPSYSTIYVEAAAAHNSSNLATHQGYSKRGSSPPSIKDMVGLLSSPGVVLFVLLICLVVSAMGEVLFSNLPRTLEVSASPKQGQVLIAGVDEITVSWGLNQSLPAGTDSAYKKVKVRLCYAPVSQADRGWRKTVNELSKDKTCQFGITIQPYNNNKNMTSFTYTVEQDVPTATYFVRAYVLDSSGTQIAYGQSTDAHKSTNLFEIVGITGRHASLDIAAGCFSAFSVVSLIFFFMVEKRRSKK